MTLQRRAERPPASTGAVARYGLALTFTLVVAGRVLAQGHTGLVMPLRTAEPDLAGVGTDTAGVSLDVFVDIVSRETGRALLLSKDLQLDGSSNTLRLTNIQAVPRDRLFDMYLAMLKSNGYTLLEIGPRGHEIYEVVKLDARRSADTMSSAKYVPPQDLALYADRPQLIRTVIPVRFTDISRAEKELERMINKAYGSVSVVNGSALLVTEFGPTVYAISQVLEVIDQQEAGTQLQFKKILLRHALAEELAPMLGELLLAASGSRSPGAASAAAAAVRSAGRREEPEASILTDPRTNSLVVYATPEDMEKIEALIAELDQEILREEGRVHLYQLRHAVADEVQATLSELLEGSGDALASGRRRGALGQSSGGAAAPGGGADAARAVIVAEPHTNSLLVQASRSQWREIKPLIDAIDIRLPQVMVQAAIVELSEDFAEAFGVDLGVVGSINGNDVVAASRLGVAPITITDTGFSRDITRLAAGTFAGGIFTDDRFDIPAIITAAKQSGSTKILSLPSVVTNDNTPAYILVGEQEPTGVATTIGDGSSTASGTGFGEYVQANLTLGISPHISSGDYLRLQIDLTIQSFGTRPQGGSENLPPPITQRELGTSVTVPDRATVILGGIKATDERNAENKIPLLGDIPFLGALFRNSSTMQSETTLYLFVTPHILREPGFGDIRDLTRQKLAEVEALVGDKVGLVDPGYLRARAGMSGDAVDPRAPSDDAAIELGGIPRYASPTDDEVPVGEDAAERESDR